MNYAVRLACLVVLFAVIRIPTETVAEDRPPWLVGGDISALAVHESTGAAYQGGDAIRAMADRGSNCFRLRIFVKPNGRGVVTNDLEYTVALAKRIKAMDAKLLLDFHYSDTWADPSHQSKPAAWESLPFDELTTTVRTYTRDVLARLKREDALPDYVQIGNEIGPGMLWPDGKLWGEANADGRGWDRLATLLRAAGEGVRDVATADETKIVVHIQCGGDREQTRHFFDNARQRNVPFDIIGLSYYPWWHGTLDDLRANLQAAAARFGKPVWVVETAYPYREMGKSGDRANEETMPWPQTPEGQAAFVRALVQVVRDVPNGRGLGVLWWYPESVPTQGLHVWNGGATALFDNDGRPVPAMDVLSDRISRP